MASRGYFSPILSTGEAAIGVTSGECYHGAVLLAAILLSGARYPALGLSTIGIVDFGPVPLCRQLPEGPSMSLVTILRG